MSDIKTILATIEKAVDKLSSGTSSKQDAAFKKLLGMVKALDTRGDTLLNNIKNLKLINNIKIEIERVIIDDKYLGQVKEFASTYHDIQKLNNEYFAKFSAEFTPKASLKVIKDTAIEATVNGLTATGIQSGVTEGIRKLLFDNMRQGGSYADLTQQLRSYMLNDDETEGALQKYVKTYSTTAINQYSAEYNKAIADDLGLEWYVYTGSLLTTSRPFCMKAVEKKYIHASEFDTILEGDFGKYGKVHVSKSTGLPDGLMKGTDRNNFARRRGGWNCGHQLIAVNDIIVPKSYKDAVYATAAYSSWKRRKAT